MAFSPWRPLICICFFEICPERCPFTHPSCKSTSGFAAAIHPANSALAISYLHEASSVACPQTQAGARKGPCQVVSVISRFLWSEREEHNPGFSKLLMSLNLLTELSLS